MPKSKSFFSDFLSFLIKMLGAENQPVLPEPNINTNTEDRMNKKALCIAINDYPGSGNDLRGCVNDAKGWANLLKTQYGFTEPILILDSQATIANVTKQWQKMINDAIAGDILVFTFSGHGTSVPDKDGDEIDGKDEALCLYDGLIIDDKIREMLSKKKDGVKLVFISDSCHSGTVTRSFINALYGEEYIKARYMPPVDDVDAVDLGHYSASSKSIFSPTEEDMNHILISGCLPTEYSYDARIGGIYQGAMSFHAISILKNNPIISYKEFYKQLRSKLPNSNWPQTPQLEGRAEEKECLMFS